MTEKTARLMTSDAAIDIGGRKTIFDEQAIDGFQTTINGDQAVRQNLNHDPKFMPIGKIRGAWKEKTNHGTHLYATVDDTHAVRKSKHKGLKQNLLTVTFTNDHRPFLLEMSTDVQGVDVRTDPRNFPSLERHNQFQGWVSKNSDSFTAGEAIRLSEIPEPLIQFFVSHSEAATLIALWLGAKAMQFIENTANSTVKNLADKAGLNLSEKMIEIAKRFCGQQVKKDSTSTVIVTLNTKPEINLITRNKDAGDHLDFDPAQLGRAFQKFDGIIKDADSITFYRETKQQDWKFRYATTADGKVITTKDTYNETVRELERLRRSVPVCICLRNANTGEDDHYETLAEFQLIDSDEDTSKYQIYFGNPPLLGQEGWVVTAITLEPLPEHTDNEREKMEDIGV